MKKFFGVFTIGFLWAASTAPLYGMLDSTDPTIIHPAAAIKATDLHEMGITGKGFKVAVIDHGFHPFYMNKIKKSIAPAAFTENLVYNPDENLHVIDVAALERAISFLENRINKNNETQREELDLYSKKTPNFTTLFNKNLFINKHINNELDQKEIERLEALIKKKNTFDALFKSDDKHLPLDGHGSLVVEALLAVAPEVIVLPIDIHRHGPRGHISEPDAIRTALQHNVDAINISLSFEYPKNWRKNPLEKVEEPVYIKEMIKACQLAQLKDVPIIYSAGNESLTFYKLKKHSPNFIEFHDCLFRRIEHIDNQSYVHSPTESAIMTVFKALNGKGIWFAAAHTYKENGEKILTNFTTYPLEKTIRNCIFVPGQNIFTQFSLGSWSGSSVSAPICTGAYILAKQYDLKLNTFISSETTLERIRTSGEEIFHNFELLGCNSAGFCLQSDFLVGLSPSEEDTCTISIEGKEIFHNFKVPSYHKGFSLTQKGGLVILRFEPDETIYRALDLRKFKKKSEEKNKLVAPPYVPMKDEGGLSFLSSLFLL